jgi:hypothetical protein
MSLTIAKQNWSPIRAGYAKAAVELNLGKCVDGLAEIIVKPHSVVLGPPEPHSAPLKGSNRLPPFNIRLSG